MSPAGSGKRTDLVVIAPMKPFVCAGCGRDDGDLARLDDHRPLCMDCADLGHLVFLPAGNTALTRRARKASTLSAVVVSWSRSRRRYERDGVLVEQQALEAAEQQCLADEDVRERQRKRARQRRAAEDAEFQQQLAESIGRLFPGCPADRAAAIARHAGARGSGRIGRTASGRALDEYPVTLAVLASIRHEDTPYDELLMAGVPRDEARARVRAAVDDVLNRWRRP